MIVAITDYMRSYYLAAFQVVLTSLVKKAGRRKSLEE
jgi:hypothetical protein